MAIVYPLTMPATPPGPRQITLVENFMVGEYDSVFTGQSQIYEQQGSWWSAKVDLPFMTRATAAPWVAFLAALNGRSGTFFLGDPLASGPIGSAGGSPIVYGGGQAGKILGITGLTGTLKAGDHFQVGSGTTQRLYMNMTDQTIPVVNTTIAASIASSPTPQIVTPAAMTNIIVGVALGIDAGNKETVVVTAITGTTFTAIFNFNHTGPGITVVGAAALDIFPRLRESPASTAALTLALPKGTFRLDANTASWVIDVAGHYSLSFGAREAF